MDKKVNMDTRHAKYTVIIWKIFGKFQFLKFQSDSEIPGKLEDHENYCLYGRRSKMYNSTWLGYHFLTLAE